jgi:hypothetical protein
MGMVKAGDVTIDGPIGGNFMFLVSPEPVPLKELP